MIPNLNIFWGAEPVFSKYTVIVESYDSASNLRFEKKNYFKIRFEIRFVVESYTSLKKIKIRFDIRFDVFVI